ncbi:MAG: hydrogenase maturation protease [Bacteroidetes bacterium]|jgi:hydrogenase maturation protease|nr:hydrogenase maturation protease [Bacteroidota bacterium]
MSHGVLVIGIGNEFRGDDAIGLLAVRDVEALHVPGVRVVESRGDGARVMRMWKGMATVLLIDAVHSGSPPGTLHRLDASHHPIPARFLCTSSHQFGVAEAVETARALGELPERVIVFGVEVEHCVAGTPPALYAVVRDALLNAIHAELVSLDPSATALYR